MEDFSLKAEEFGLRLKELREKNGLTQTSLARKVGLSITSVQNFEGGQFPRGEHAIKLAYILGVSLDELLLGKGFTLSEQTESQRDKNLEDELAKERQERRELAAENRQLHRDKELLLREIGELREKVARLEERKRRYELTHGLAVEERDVG